MSGERIYSHMAEKHNLELVGCDWCGFETANLLHCITINISIVKIENREKITIEILYKIYCKFYKKILVKILTKDPYTALNRKLFEQISCKKIK